MDLLPKKQIFSVSELTHSIKMLFESQYRFIHVQGEISNLKTPYSGHQYFTLKDSNAQIRAVLFKSQQKYLREKLSEGQHVTCHGRLSVYEPRGDYQIIVDTVELSGEGALYLEFEKLKRKLAEKGLFQQDRKKKIPPFPETISIITSPQGAAIHDFLKVVEKRRYNGHILVIPVLVQGKSSSKSIVQALRTAHQIKENDIIVLLRGGGSLEDLWSFNEEETVTAISEATLPVVTGIGHEIDLTLADLCADYSAHTPTAIAESIIPDTTVVSNTIEHLLGRVHRSLQARLHDFEKRIAVCLKSITNVESSYQTHTLRLDYAVSQLIESIQHIFLKKQMQINDASNTLKIHSPESHLAVQETILTTLQRRLQQAIITALAKNEKALQSKALLLDSVSPLSVLARGYSITRKGDQVISDADAVIQGDELELILKKGRLFCEVKNRFSS